MAEEYQEVRIHVPLSAYESLVTQRESLMRAMSDLDAIREESDSVMLKLAMDGALKRIGEVIVALTEVTRRD